MSATQGSFTALDWVVVGVYFAAMLAIGVVLARRQRTTEDFFLAGRSIPVWAAAISIVGVSAATFIGAPESAYAGNLSYLSANLAQFVGVTIVALVFVPAFYRAGATTVYHLLESTLGERSRMAASAAFLVGRLFAAGARLFIAAIPVSLIVFGDLSTTHLTLAIVVVAVVALAYTVLGGLDAVIWTDVAQTFLFVGAAAAAVALLLHRIPTPLPEIIHALGEARAPDGTSKLTALDTRWDPTSDFNLWSALIGLTLFNIAVYATDQDLGQRLLTFRTARKSAWSVFLSNFVGLAIAAVFLAIGLLLYVMYRMPELMAGATPTPPDDSRRLFLHFIFEEAPAGVRGLLIAGLFAGAMGALASSVSAMSSAVVNDFYKPLKPGRTERHYMRVSRISVVGWGALLTVFAIGCVAWQERSGKGLIPFAMGVMLYAYTGLLAVFLTAILTRRGSTASVIAALFTGALIVAVLEFGPALTSIAGQDTGLPTLSLGWRMFVGTLGAFAVCVVGRRRVGATP